MATQANHPYGFHPKDPQAKLQSLKVAATQTIARGDCCYLDTGQVKIAAAGQSSVCGVCAETVSAPAANTRIALWGVANPHEVFRATHDADSSSIVTAVLTDLVGTTGIQQLDTSESTDDLFINLIAIQEDVLATARCMWEITINPAKHDLHL